MKSNKLTTRIAFAMVAGIVVGYLCHTYAPSSAIAKEIAGYLSILTDIFLRLIKMVIAPLVLATLVAGLASMGDSRAVGRIGGKALGWFITASLCSLLIGLVMANLLRPGDNLAVPLPEISASTNLKTSALNLKDFITHVFPKSSFGHETGAYTGASRRRVGKIEHAKGGTLFLDEIESMPLAMQTKRLRVLQERSLERLGSNTPIPVDYRVLAATKVDLKALADEGKFRADLYYRLNVANLLLPPLRLRREDFLRFCSNTSCFRPQHVMNARCRAPVKPMPAPCWLMTGRETCANFGMSPIAAFSGLKQVSRLSARRFRQVLNLSR